MIKLSTACSLLKTEEHEDESPVYGSSTQFTPSAKIIQDQRNALRSVAFIPASMLVRSATHPHKQTNEMSTLITPLDHKSYIRNTWY